ncbi:hypothetical protein Godav_010843, partial [Gossypium davidsonii]|nr:hypothetical protein [Gossypium davidsonii]MBA0644988.1 hypothetical protein [Gossypium klotzschianum]
LIFNAELWGIIDGLVLIQNRHYDDVLIQTNNLEMIKAIQDFSLSSSNSAIIRRIHHLLLDVGL